VNPDDVPAFGSGGSEPGLCFLKARPTQNQIAFRSA
jgi:hypothetical protein